MSRTLSSDQKGRAADEFHADRSLLYASKKILDAKHPKYKNVTRIINDARVYWVAVTVPFPESGLRLIRKKKIQEFCDDMQDRKESLEEAVAELEAAYADLREAAQEKLGDLFNPADYPSSLAGEFEISWDFPSVTVPEYLKQLNPELYEQQQKRIAAKFDAAVSMAEEAFFGQFAEMVARIADRLKPNADGKKQVFRDTLVGNIHDFFDAFGEMSLRSNQQLDALIEKAKNTVSGISAQDIRDNDGLRNSIQREFSGIQQQLESLMTTTPDREIELT